MQPKKGFYYHYKHDPSGAINNFAYEILGVAKNSEDNALSVIYRPLYKSDYIENSDFYSRPLTMFVENVTINSRSIPRFSLIKDEKIIHKLDKIKLELYN